MFDELGRQGHDEGRGNNRENDGNLEGFQAHVHTKSEFSRTANCLIISGLESLALAAF